MRDGFVDIHGTLRVRNTCPTRPQIEGHPSPASRGAICLLGRAARLHGECGGGTEQSSTFRYSRGRVSGKACPGILVPKIPAFPLHLALSENSERLSRPKCLDQGPPLAPYGQETIFSPQLCFERAAAGRRLAHTLLLHVARTAGSEIPI